MLVPEATFPYPGSYALFIDTDLPPAQQNAELARIIWRREGWAMVSFPLRDGASGNKTVAFADLIDATPLSTEDAREFHDLDRALAGRSGRTPKQKREIARRDLLKQRVVWAPVMARLLRQARSRVRGWAA